MTLTTGTVLLRGHVWNKSLRDNLDENDVLLFTNLNKTLTSRHFKIFLIWCHAIITGFHFLNKIISCEQQKVII